MAKTLSNRDCDSKVNKLTKLYDNKCPGFFVQKPKTGDATFYFRYLDKVLGKQVDIRIGLYVKDEFTLLDARAKAFNYRACADQGESLMQTLRKVTDQRKREGKTVAEILDEYEAWAKTEVRKPDGEMRPRIESWYGAIGYLRRFTGTALGSMVASEVENDHIAQVQNDIIAGRYGKPSVGNARQFRKSASAMFEWAAEAGRKYVKVNPCHHLPGLDSQPARDRVLSAEEIKVLWWGLDDPALGCTRQIALALKFQLVTMLRSKEFLHSQPHEFSDLGTENARFTIPLKRVKKRRKLIIPMSDLAQEIIAEARKLKDGKSPYVFPGKLDGEPLDEKALGHAVRGITSIRKPARSYGRESISSSA